MADLRRTLLFLYIIYILSAPCFFTFLLLKYHHFSSVLFHLMIGNSMSTLILFILVFLLKNNEKRFWYFISLVVVSVVSTIWILSMIYVISNRINHDFKFYRKMFREAIDQQVSIYLTMNKTESKLVFIQIQYLKEPSHPIWSIIMFKQCCGTVSNQIDRTSKENQWFRQIPISMFCTDIPVERTMIDLFEQKSRMTYSPRGACISVIENELKIEFISASVIVGLGIFILLLTWLFQYQYWEIHQRQTRMKLKKKERIFSQSLRDTHSPVTNDIGSPSQSQSQSSEFANRSITLVDEPPAQRKLIKGFVMSSEDFR